MIFLLPALFATVWLNQGCSKSATHKTLGARPTEPGLEATDSATVTAADPSTMKDDCPSLAQTACARLEVCAPFLTQAYYGSVAVCESVLGEICQGLTEQGKSPDFVRCRDSLQGCSAIVEQRSVPGFCWNAPGQIENGGACLVDTDCTVGLCQRAKGDDHGTCAKPADEGSECLQPVRCQLGLRCDATTATCLRPAGLGANCDSPFACESGLSCNADGKCEATAAGSPCVSGIIPCGASQDCVFDECVERSLGDGDCKNPSTECSGTERCVVQQLASFEQTAECRDTLRFDAECDATTPCIEPLSCRGGRCAP
jgi:hypothetical protein